MDRPRILALVDAKRLPAVAQALDDSRVDLHCRVEAEDATHALAELGRIDLIVVWPSGLDWLSSLRAEHNDTPALLAMAPGDRLARFLRARKELQVGGILLDDGGEDEHWVAQLLENLVVLARGARQRRALNEAEQHSTSVGARFEKSRTKMLASCSPAAQIGAFERNEDLHDIDRLLADLSEETNPAGGPQRVRRLCLEISSMLGWPSQERRALGLASLLHHCRMKPEERLLELRGGIAHHARRSADKVRTLGIAGLSGVAEIIEFHHASLDQPAPRAARLLKILSFFDELMHDPEVAVASRQLGQDLGLVRATEWLLHFSGSSFEPTLAERCALQYLPSALGRSEHPVVTAELEVGQTLSRTIYSANMIVVPGQTTVESNLIKQLARTEGLSEIWVWNDGASNTEALPATRVLSA